MEVHNRDLNASIRDAAVPRILTFEKRLTVIVARDEDQYCAYCPELDLVTEMGTPEEALEDMVEAMKDYAEEYLQESGLYSNSPNRAHHLPYLRTIASCKDNWDIKMLIEVQYGLVHV